TYWNVQSTPRVLWRPILEIRSPPAPMDPKGPPISSGRYPPRLTVLLPLWIPSLLMAVVSAILFRVSRDVSEEHCSCCRYDLRGLRPGTPCPECGRPPPARNSSFTAHTPASP